MNRWLMIPCWLAVLGGDTWAAVGPEMARMIDALASPVFAVRQQAAKDLTRCGEAHFEEVKTALAHAYRNSADPEVRFMSREILTSLFVSRLGYLGINYMISEYVNPAGVNQSAVGILALQPDTPAAKGGLLVGDLIFSLNGKPLSDAAFIDWPQQIKAIDAGSPVTLGIARNGKDRQVTFKVGRWPLPLTASEQSTLFKQKISEIAPLVPPEG